MYDPVCACNGIVYPNECEAAAAGWDVADQGTCTPPAGYASCGAHYCDPTTQYCFSVWNDLGDGPASYRCVALPAVCGGSPSCDCLRAETCGFVCAPTPGGGFMLTCYPG